MSPYVLIRAGKAVKLTFSITVGLPPVLTNPATALVSIEDPDGVVQVVAQPATAVSTGIYTYTYVTSSVGVLGNYVVWLDCTDSMGNPSGSLKIIGFILVSP